MEDFQKKIEELEKRIKELEARPPILISFPMPVYVSNPPAPVYPTYPQPFLPPWEPYTLC